MTCISSCEYLRLWCSRGYLTTKIHLLADEQGLTADFVVTAGQNNDCAQAITLLGERKVSHVLADKGYDSDAIVVSQPWVPSRSSRTSATREVQRAYDKKPPQA